MKSLLLVVLLISVVVAQDMMSPVEEATRTPFLLSSMSEGSFTHRRFWQIFFRPETKMEANAFKKNCEEYGPPGHYEQLGLVLNEMTACADNAFTSTPSPSQGDAREVARVACRLAPLLGACLVHVGEAVKLCMPPARREKLLLANLTHSLVNYACDNDGDKLQAYIGGGGPGCINSSMMQLIQCTAKLDKEEVVNSIKNTIETGEVNCKQTVEVVQCVEDKLAACPTPAASDIFKGVVDVVVKFSPCPHLFQDQPPHHLQHTL